MFDAILIDNDPLHCKITEIYMRRRLGIGSFKSFNNSEEALSYLLTLQSEAKKLPEIILLDLIMPGFNGWRFLEIFKNINATAATNSAVFIITTSNYTADIERANLFTCVKGYFNKPFSDRALDTILEEVNSLFV